VARFVASSPTGGGGDDASSRLPFDSIDINLIRQEAGSGKGDEGVGQKGRAGEAVAGVQGARGLILGKEDSVMEIEENIITRGDDEVEQPSGSEASLGGSALRGRGDGMDVEWDEEAEGEEEEEDDEEEEDEEEEEIFQAVAERDVARVERLVREDRGVLSSRDWEGGSPLIAAAAEGDVQIVRVLLEFGAETGVRDVGRQTALHYALPATDDMPEYEQVSGQRILTHAPWYAFT
jgi:hypothetical protein